ncbi:MAG: aminoacyl--tRNA ligase-related protein [Bacteroidota bacterium]|nr:aminoacyl--tRNA ligase-related protein [Bacteroidota bacterium]
MIVLEDLLKYQFHVLDNSGDLIKVNESTYPSLEKNVQTLIYQEFYGEIPKQFYVDRKAINEVLQSFGFLWDNMSEYGHMKQRPEAVTIMESIEKYVWKMVKDFCYDQNIPLHRIRGGELLSLENPQISKLYKIITSIASYGNNQYTWSKSEHKGLLRYSACLQKLMFANEIEKGHSNLPIGIFEVSKSYRDEKSETLQLCERVRSFLLPEMHILNDSFDSALEITMMAHKRIIENINCLYSDQLILCKMTHSFFNEHLDFLKRLAVSSGNTLVLWVLKEGELCNNGVQVDIEYKVTDISGAQVEIATLQVDKGDSEFALDVQYLDNQKQYQPVSTIHCVFFGSIERAVYCLVDSSLKRIQDGSCNQLPIWVAPIQTRIIPENENHLKIAKAFAFELEQTGCRVDIDDRKIPYYEKINCDTLKWVPNLIKIVGDNNVCKFTENYEHENSKEKQLTQIEIIERVSKVIDKQLVVPRYTPLEMSKKF